MKTYREILLDGLKTTWRSKYLWFFGVFAVLFSGTGYQALIGGDVADKDSFLSTLWSIGFFDMGAWGRQFVQAPFMTSLVVLFWFFVLVMFLFLVWLSIVSRVAIVKNIYLIKESLANNFESGIKSGIKYFWPVLGLNLVFIVFVTVAVTVINAPMLNIVNATVSSIFFAILFVILLVLAILFSFIVKFATAFVVIKENKLKEAVVNAYNLFVKNWLVVLEMVTVLFFINVASVIASFIAISTFVFPMFWLIDFVSPTMPIFAFWIWIFVTIFIFLFSLLIVAIISTFQISSWTILFMELITEGKKSKLVTIFSRRG